MRLMSQSAMSIRLSSVKNGSSQLWNVMGILGPSCESESMDTVCRFVVCMVASCVTTKRF